MDLPLFFVLCHSKVNVVGFLCRLDKTGNSKTLRCDRHFSYILYRDFIEIC